MPAETVRMLHSVPITKLLIPEMLVNIRVSVVYFCAKQYADILTLYVLGDDLSSTGLEPGFLRLISVRTLRESTVHRLRESTASESI